MPWKVSVRNIVHTYDIRCCRWYRRMNGCISFALTPRNEKQYAGYIYYKDIC